MANNEKCTECGGDVNVMTQRGTGICSGQCDDAANGGDKRPSAQTDAGVTNLLREPKGVQPGGIVM